MYLQLYIESYAKILLSTNYPIDGELETWKLKSCIYHDAFMQLILVYTELILNMIYNLARKIRFSLYNQPHISQKMNTYM